MEERDASNRVSVTEILRQMKAIKLLILSAIVISIYSCDKKVENLFFTGQLTVPGPGVPPSIISGKIVSQMVIKNTTKNIIIPMRGAIDSMNVSVAAAILLFEAKRQRGF